MIVRWSVRVAIVAALLVLAQRLAGRGEELEATGADLERQRVAMGRTEGDLDDLDRQLDDLDARLADLDARLTATETTHGGKIPRAQYEDYLRLVDERNEVASERNTVLAYRGRVERDYAADVERHNGEVAEANARARHSTPWAMLGGLWAELTAAWDS